jgi:O-antigen/teichoic acid export membrane protein
LFWLASPAISWFYDNSIYGLIVLPLSVGVLFNTMSIVPIASLQKDKKFISIARSELFAELASLALVLSLVGKVEAIWALSCKPLVFAIVRFMLLWLASARTSTKRSKFGVEFDGVKALLGFSLYQSGFNITNYFSKCLDNILVGKYFNAESLGVYSKAYQLMSYPLLMLTFAMSPAIQPVLTEIKHDKYEFERLHNKFIMYMALLGLIVGVLVCVLSEIIVDILLGSQWGEVVPLLEILSIIIPVQVVLSSSGGFYQAAGRADLLFKCGLFAAITNITAICYGVYSESLESICWSIVCSFSINIVQCYYIMGKNLFPGKIKGVAKVILFLMSGVLVLSLFVINRA